MASVPSQSVRVQGSRFAEALTKEELSIICFIYKVPEGERERRGSAIEVFRYLEERGCINYSQPEQLVKLMRLVQREKWARETEEMISKLLKKISCLCSTVTYRVLPIHISKLLFLSLSFLSTSRPSNPPCFLFSARDSSLHTHSPIHYPVEEESIAPDQTDVVLRPRSQVSQIRNKRRRAIRSCSPSREREERDGPLRQDGRACSNSCDSCKAFFRAIKSPETTEHIAEAVHKTIIEQLSKLSLEDECHSQEDEEELTEQDQDAGGEEKVGSRFSRKGSTISHKSTRSSGYGSMLFENPPSIVFGTVEEEQPDASSSSSDTISPTTTIRPEFDSLLGSFLTPPPPLSRQSSNDEYCTATSEDESREGGYF